MKSGLWAGLLICSLAATIPLQRWMDQQRGSRAVIEESLYITSGKTLRRLSLGYHSFVADVYWLRAIQYFGGKLGNKTSRGEQVNINNVSELGLDLLHPFLSLTSELDPKFIQPIRFGAVFLPDINPEKAIEYVKQGIENNPQEWRLYQDLAYIYWQQKRFQEAAATYEKGTQLPDAPGWFKTMQAVMVMGGGDRTTSRLMFQKLYEESQDEYTKSLYASRLKFFQAQDEMDLLNEMLSQYRAQAGSCPPSLDVLTRAAITRLRNHPVAQKMNVDERLTPLDPEGTPYELHSQECVVSLSEDTKIVKFKF